MCVYIYIYLCVYANTDRAFVLQSYEIIYIYRIEAYLLHGKSRYPPLLPLVRTDLSALRRSDSRGEVPTSHSAQTATSFATGRWGDATVGAFQAMTVLGETNKDRSTGIRGDALLAWAMGHVLKY